jgi:dynamin GTPase
MALASVSPPFLQESPVASKIREAFFSEKGLAGHVSKLHGSRDKLFDIESVKKVSGEAWI